MAKDIFHFLRVHFEIGDGITTVVRETQKQQSMRGFHSRIVALSSDNIPLASSELKGVGFFWSLNAINADTKRSAIKMFHGIFSLRLIILGWYCLLSGHRVFVTPHSSLTSASFGKGWARKKLFYWIFVSRLLPRVEGVIFLNSAEERSSIYPTGTRCHLVDNGVAWPPKIPDINYLRIEKMLFLGRYDVQHKGIDILINQYGRYAENCFSQAREPMMLEFYGSGQRDQVGVLINTRKAGKFISVNGSVFGQKKLEVLQKYSIFVLLSRYEGTPMAALEAMSFGCIPIVSRGTNLAELVELYKCGWVVSPTLDLSKILSEYKSLSEERKRLMRCAAREAVRSRHNWEDIISAQARIFFLDQSI